MRARTAGNEARLSNSCSNRPNRKKICCSVYVNYQSTKNDLRVSAHFVYPVVVKGLIEIVYHHALLIPEIHMHIHIQFIQKYVDI